MRGEKGQPVYREFVLELFIKALTKLDFKYNTKLPRNIQTFLTISNHFANNIHLYFCSCIKLSNTISSSSVVSILCPKILELSTIHVKHRESFILKNLLKGMKSLFTFKQWFSTLASYYNYLYIKVFI